MSRCDNCGAPHPGPPVPYGHWLVPYNTAITVDNNLGSIVRYRGERPEYVTTELPVPPRCHYCGVTAWASPEPAWKRLNDLQDLLASGIITQAEALRLLDSPEAL